MTAGGRPDAAPDLDPEVCYRALATRDRRFDGRFYTAVLSTGIYCRPVCPARTPKIENCLFLPSAAAAHQMGFRPCLRCRPEAAPGLAVTRGTGNTVARALILIGDGALDGGSVDDLASRLGVGERHLRRLFDRHVGASPVAVAQVHRILFAKTLIDGTGLGMADIALAAGFGSIRRFNEVFRKTYGRPPGSLRRDGSRSQTESDAKGGGLVLPLPFSLPYDWPALLEFLERHAIPGVEQVEGGHYRRSFRLNGHQGWVDVHRPDGARHLLAAIHTDTVAILGQVVQRLRRLFDLDADMALIDGHLAADPLLARRVRARPGIRVPGAWDAFELAVRACLGQQVSVAATTTFAGRLAIAAGPIRSSADDGPARLFPTAGEVVAADLSAVGLTGPRAAALTALARALTVDPALLHGGDTLEDTVARLTTLPGIGPGTAHTIAMRALREPDAFPAADLGLLRAARGAAVSATARELEARSQGWRPWRAYAAVRLWCQEDVRGG